MEWVVSMMRNLSACRAKHREVKGGKMIGIRARDLMRNYCVAQAEKHEGVRQWRKDMAKGFKRGCKICGGRDGDAGWWSEEVADDSCMHINLARHLVESGETDELEILVLDCRWAMRQLRVNRYLGVESGFWRSINVRN